ncbi:OmpA family protein [Rhodocytophaga rosea]|uniref:OmpA family protein n=1 Tax=Rhodocytophaga rosea TaxID=2704465 RepID=A0A6C0GNX9_9BACT|nr:OmpA family protein [Rhodocytophaga rosea]QHT69554.1 OmpA family protein [Rhodocytophaga rosea]
MKKKIIILALALTGAIYSCNQNQSSQDNSTADANVEKTEEALDRTDISAKETDADTALEASEWIGVDLDNHQVRVPEITVKDVEVRENDRYTNYSLDETILFESGVSALRPQAQESLQQIAASISNRSKGKIRIYGYTDSKESAASNKELSKQRAEAVKQWLVQEGKMDASRISIHPMGESKPEASNKTEAGRQQNRRVEIVVMNNQ